MAHLKNEIYHLQLKQLSLICCHRLAPPSTTYSFPWPCLLPVTVKRLDLGDMYALG